MSFVLICINYTPCCLDQPLSSIQINIEVPEEHHNTELILEFDIPVVGKVNLTI